MSGHGTWSANSLVIEAQNPGPPALGRRFQSKAELNGLVFQAKLEITAFERPSCFAFTGEDSTGRFTHTFRLIPEGPGTRLHRQAEFELSARQWLWYWALLLPVRLPAARKALDRLAARLETPTV
jgi:hypothetical protein